jgi:hypothetical protein
LVKFAKTHGSSKGGLNMKKIKDTAWKIVGGLLVASAAKEMLGAIDVAVNGSESDTAKKVDGFFAKVRKPHLKKPSPKDEEVIDVDNDFFEEV